jgi:hypothetical protein
VETARKTNESQKDNKARGKGYGDRGNDDKTVDSRVPGTNFIKGVGKCNSELNVFHVTEPIVIQPSMHPA